jgi:dTDP-4-amino-4,6-dideoxygalactose transaminase
VNIPLVDIAAQQAEINAEVREGLDDVFATAAFIGGKAVSEFELAYAEATDVAHCVGVANGTDALELALRAAGVTSGGEVILPANTFIATAEAVSRIGARPVLVDCDPTYLLIDPGKAEAAITSRTQAIVPVHLFGQVAPVEQLIEIAVARGIPVVEDAAQSQGATRHGRFAGSLGLVAATSFYPGKNLGAAGDAGAVTTNDADIAAKVRLVAGHGSSKKYIHEVVGVNSRLDTIQAVVLRAKLRRLPAWNAKRQAASARYAELLADVEGVRLPTSAPGNDDVWHLYVVRVAERDRALAELHQSGIGAGIHYPYPVHLTAAYSSLGYGRGSFPVAEQASNEILSLPLFPHITENQQVRVVNALSRTISSQMQGGTP